MSRKNIIRDNPQETFICLYCGRGVSPVNSGGAQRNHCPHCLNSLHVDILTGDRRALCRGIMKPIGIWMKGRREAVLIHRCENCGMIRTNRVAADDNEMLLFTLAASPLMQLPFPSDRVLESLEKISGCGEVICG